jgi:hypothetical protein
MNWPLPIVPRGAETRGMVSHRCARHPLFTSTLVHRRGHRRFECAGSSRFKRELPRPLRTGSGAGRTRCPEHDLALGRVLRPTRAALRSVSGPATTIEHIPARYWFVTDRRTRPQRHISRIRAATSACAEAPHALASSTKSTGQVRHSKRSRMLSGINRLRGANTYESP